MEKYKEILSDIGLSKWESQTYLALLNLGQTTTGPLVKKSEVPQSKIYGVLENMHKKGFVSWVMKGKTKYFQASDPSKILVLYKEKEKSVEKMVEELELKKSSIMESTAQIYEGMDAISAFFHEMIYNTKKGEPWYGWSRGIYADEKVIEFYTLWGPKRNIQGMKNHYLLISKKNQKEFEKYWLKEDLIAIKKNMRYIDLDLPGDFTVFKDYVVTIIWEIPMAFVIKSKELAEQYKQFYKSLWKKSNI